VQLVVLVWPSRYATFTNNASQYAFGFCSLQYAQIISGGPVNRNVKTTLVGGASADRLATQSAALPLFLCTRMGIAARSLHEAGQIDTACGASEMPDRMSLYIQMRKENRLILLYLFDIFI
jgi:hypothetical protein